MTAEPIRFNKPSLEGNELAYIADGGRDRPHVVLGAVRRRSRPTC